MANQTPLERAARALWRTRADEFNDWDSLDGEEREVLRLEARAVLLAIREPSEAMCQAARDANYLFGITTQESDAIGWTFQAMIDVALEE